MSTVRFRRSLALAVLVGTLSSPPLTLHAAGIPPVPIDRDLISDFASLLPPEAKAQIRAAQRKAFESNNTPIVVVTIRRMSDYGGAGMSIEEFARRWFDQWQIGTLKAPGGANTGILLLISSGDRRARIELGADWGHHWDDAAQRIMDGTIIPKFKAGDFSGGTAAGVEELVKMAETGPSGRARSPGVIDRVAQSEPAKKIKAFSPFPIKVILGIVAAGIVLIIASLFFPEHRKMLLVAGIVLIIVGALTYVVLVIIALMFGGARSSGGGFGGGSSGGGGASGSW